MTTSNLAIVIGPNLAREKVPSPFGEINITTKVSPLVELMIRKYDEIFPKDPPPKFSKATPRSSSIVFPSSNSQQNTSIGSLLGSRRVPRPRPMKPKTPPKPPPRRGTGSNSSLPSPRAPTIQAPTPPVDIQPEQEPEENLEPPIESIPPESEETNNVIEENTENTSNVDTEDIHCARCKQLLGTEVIEVLGKVWHPQCFVCSMCSTELSNGFFKHKGNPVCK
eukprot:CAMPEP_0206180668 /NCGR_PEP_ID=MMETSP1474-20131121/68160_1 /ASSEMBLY_ACC=CAM_ASM_001110 /TAXON_ID=97495 /ORGANISM="Imantonia sp., Strain RCC918" /LENGTH=222 /DNA_ID=CAMNT_0053594403 /DNA_START=1532 /DNA_END=2197 /DNA_ORIENTATION=-